MGRIKKTEAAARKARILELKAQGMSNAAIGRQMKEETGKTATPYYIKVALSEVE